ncbi:MAG: matrixin family metalloprotease [Burkholderiales bacterium]|nr:matrixin family metalloprotease [Burkholderiales bacterium]
MATPTTGLTGIPSALSGDPRINALLVGVKWESPVLSYSFLGTSSAFSTSVSTGYGPSTDTSSEPWNSRYSFFGSVAQAAASSAMAKWAAVANLSFTPTTESATNNGDIRFGFTDVGNAQAHAYSPSVAAGGDVWFSYTERSKSFAEGSYDYMTLIHEIGHALGLKHPFDVETGNTAVLPASLDSQSYTVMSYSAQGGDSATDFTYRPTTPMVLDIQAIQYLYGANTGYSAGNTTYTFVQGGDYNQTIWDGGGVDTISFTGSDAAIIDLRPGGGSRVGNTLYVVNAQGARLNSVSDVWVAVGAVIERAAGGLGPDQLIGSDGANLLDGGSGNDTMAGGAGNDRIEGSAGTDVAMYSGASGDYTVTFNAATGRYAIGDRTMGRDGTDVVSSVESFQFSDGVKTAAALTVSPVVQGDARTIIGVSEGFFGFGPGASQYAQSKSFVASSGASAFALAVGNSFAAADSTLLAGQVLANFGISAATLGGSIPDQSYAALADAVSIIFTAFATSRGQVVLNIVNLLAGLETDVVYGQVAAALANKVTADASVLVGVTLVGVPEPSQASA